MVPTEEGTYAGELGNWLSYRDGAVAHYNYPSLSEIQQMNEPTGSTTSKIRDALFCYYNNDDLISLCMDLGIDHEDLKGDTKQIKVIELIDYLQNRGRIQDLIAVCSRQRPHMNWDELPKVSSTTWIYLPPSEQVQQSYFIILSYTMAYTLDRDGNPIGLYSEEVELTAGKWIPITLRLTYNGYTKDASLDSKGRRIHEFYLTIWSDQPYTGLIYIDDITFYTDITDAR